MVSRHRLVLLSLLGAASLPMAEAAPASYIIQTVAGSDNSGDGGQALLAALSQPEGIAVDRAGNVYIADAAVHRVRKIATDGSIHTVAGAGVPGFAGDGGPAVAALLNQPYGLALDQSGNLYIADLGNARVRKISADGVIQTVAGGGVLPASSTGQGGPATSVQLMQPRNVALDAAGSLYISDFGANQVYCVSAIGTLSLRRRDRHSGISGVGTSAWLAQLNSPAGLTMDPTGALYIADSGNNLVRKVSNGVITSIFNTPAPTGVAVDSTGILYVAAAGYFGTISQQISSIASAQDVTLDLSGNVYFTSSGFVMEIPNGGAPVTIAGSGTAPNFGGDGRAGHRRAIVFAFGYRGGFQRQLVYRRYVQQSHPHGDAGRCDQHHRGRRYGRQPAANSTLRAASPSTAQTICTLPTPATTRCARSRRLAPSTSIASQLNNPVSVAVDAQGSVYIADSGNNRIVEVTAAGTASTLANINAPLAVAVDASGNVLVADATQIWTITSDGATSSLIIADLLHPLAWQLHPTVAC